MGPGAFLERAVCAGFGTAAYSSLPKRGHGFDETALATARRDARYFGISNGIRGAALVPLVWFMRHGPWVSEVFSATALAFHGILALVELYRFRALSGLSPEIGRASPPPSLERPRIHPYFGPFAWEPVWLYRAFGCMTLKILLIKYVEWTRGEKIAPANSRAAVIKTIYESRQAEVVHLIGAVFDSVILFGTLTIPGFWWFIPAYAIFTDVEIVLLQRTHRVRLRRVHVGVPG